MNREIKFRVWDGHTKSFFDAEGTHYLPKIKFDDGAMKFVFVDDQYQIMQFTGIKDKNGKDIYELHEINNMYRVLFKDLKYVLQDISNGDIVEMTINSEQYEITREYSPL